MKILQNGLGIRWKEKNKEVSNSSWQQKQINILILLNLQGANRSYVMECKRHFGWSLNQYNNYLEFKITIIFTTLYIIQINKMVVNDNGFDVTTLTYDCTRQYISEGAVVGIVFGWIVGIIGLYIVGICIIIRCTKDDESDEGQSSKEKQSPPTPDNNMRRRRINQDHPTMEMMVYTNGNEENVQKDFEEQIE